MNKKETANSEPFCFNFEIGDTSTCILGVKSYLVVIKRCVKNVVAIYKSGSNNPKIKCCLSLLSVQML